jgi:hypothetical protein
MKQLIFIFAFIFSVSLGQNAAAQNRDKDSHSDRWERYRSEKVAFLTEKLELTPAEAQKFWPVYNELEQKKWEAQKERREIERKIKDAEENMSEKEIIKLTRDFANGMQTESELIYTYNEKFLEVLPPHKVLKLYKAENEFRMHMIKKFRDRRKKDNE